MRDKLLANEHWSYIEKLLNIHNVNKEEINQIAFHYISAFIHGYGHALKDIKKGLINIDEIEI